MDLEALKEVVGTKVLLSFSCGKDSLCCWLALREAGYEVVPFYMALIPGLEFVERSLRYYEGFFGQPIARVLHPSLYIWLNQLVSQPPPRLEAIRLLGLPQFKYEHVEVAMRRRAGMDEMAFSAVGLKYADSRMRANRMPKDGVNLNTRKFYPIADWKKEDEIQCMKRHGVKLPVDYAIFARSWDGVDYRFLQGIRKYFPEDYARILEWLPEQGMEFARVAFARKHGQDLEMKGKKR